METQLTELHAKIDNIEAKMDKLIREVHNQTEYNKSFENRFKQWAIFYMASLVADETLQINKR